MGDGSEPPEQREMNATKRRIKGRMLSLHSCTSQEHQYSEAHLIFHERYERENYFEGVQLIH